MKNSRKILSAVLIAAAAICLIAAIALTAQRFTDTMQTRNTMDELRTSTEPLPPATIDAIKFDASTGCITGTTKDTKEDIVIGYLAIGNVTNPNGVSHIGSSYYTAGAGAGDLNVTMLGGAAKEVMTIDAQGNEVKGIRYVNGSIQSLYREENDGNANDPVSENDLPENSRVNSAGKTELITGFLEAPNVDLATEISELITTQRGYQANTRIITVTDSMLEELVNMKR